MKVIEHWQKQKKFEPSQEQEKLQRHLENAVQCVWSQVFPGSPLCHYCPTFLNPFTPKSDQFRISPSASQEILHHTVWRTWLFIAYSDERWLYYQFSLPHLHVSPQEGWENVIFELGSERVKLPNNNYCTVVVTFPPPETQRTNPCPFFFLIQFSCLLLQVLLIFIMSWRPLWQSLWVNRVLWCLAWALPPMQLTSPPLLARATWLSVMNWIILPLSWVPGCLELKSKSSSTMVRRPAFFQQGSH